MAKDTINVGAVPNDGTGDPIRTAMQYVNSNFTEIYTALGPDGDNVVNIVNSGGEIELLNTANKISFLYDTEAEVLALNTGTHHGVIAHAHDTGALYYCHGAWRKVLTDTSGGAVTNYTDPLSAYVYGDNITNLEVADYVLKTNNDGTYTWVANAGGGGATNLADLSDVTISSASNGQVLKYNGSVWTNLTDATGGGGGTLLDLTDTPASYGTAGQALVVNSGADGLEFTTISGGGGGTLDGLTDTDISNVQTNQILQWNGNDWANFALSPSFASISDQPASQSDQVIFENIWKNASTVLTVTANGSTAYRFDQYGTTDNPTIYVKAGTTVGFDLTYDSGGTHPFKIQTTGGSDISDGIFELTSGNVYTDFSGGGAYGGTLYWKVPADLSGDFQYICTAHGAMLGTITVEAAAGGGGGGSASRNTEAQTTASIANGASGNIEFTTIGKSYSLYKIQSNGAAWVRIYSDTASRTADAGRTQGQDPAEGSGVIAEGIFTGSGTLRVTPAVMGWLDNSESNVPVAVQNNTGSTGTVQVTLTALTLET